MALFLVISLSIGERGNTSGRTRPLSRRAVVCKPCNGSIDEGGRRQLARARSCSPTRSRGRQTQTYGSQSFIHAPVVIYRGRRKEAIPQMGYSLISRGCDGGVRQGLAQLGGQPRLARSSSSPSRYFCLRECPICPMSINLTPYRIRGVAYSRHCSGKLVLAAANLLGPMANLVCFVHIKTCQVPETVHCG